MGVSWPPSLAVVLLVLVVVVVVPECSSWMQLGCPRGRGIHSCFDAAYGNAAGAAGARGRNGGGGVVLMSLRPLSTRDARRLVPSLPNKKQLENWLGQTSLQRQGRVAEELGVGVLAMWFSFFLSRMPTLGRFFPPLFVLLLLLRWGLSPWLVAYRTNVNLLARKRGDRPHIAALYLGRVKSCAEKVAPYADHHIHFRMVVADEESRELTLEVPMLPAYRRVGKGMKCVAIVFAEAGDSDFEEVRGVTEVYIPSAQLCVGHYPFIDEAVLWELLNKELRKERRDRHRRREGARDERYK